MKLTIRKYADAIEKNGLPQTFGRMFTYGEKNQIVAACAMGQAKLNLNIATAELSEFERGFHTGLSDPDICPICLTIKLNDGEKLPLTVIANKLSEHFADVLDKEIEVS